jgi:hypothetical protein
MKDFALVDASMFYTGNMEICVGTQPQGWYKISNNPADVGERWFEPISGSRRNAIFGNSFTSCELSVKMLTGHRLIIADILRENKQQIPLKCLSMRVREKKTSLFRFQENVRYYHTYLIKERRHNRSRHYIMMTRLTATQKISGNPR